MGIYRLSSDLEDLEGLGKSLRLRKMEQKYLYMGEGAYNYYNDGNTFSIDKGYEADIKKSKIDFGAKILQGKEVLLSLGCGMAKIEKDVLEKVGENIDFFGIDSSEDMLKMLDSYYKNINNKKVLIKGDISSYEFKRELKELLKQYKKPKVFSFLGNTIGSIENTSIVDILYSLMDSKDLLWLDVRLRGDCTMSGDMKLFNAYNKGYNTKSGKKFLMNKLTRFGIVDEDANIKVSMKKEDITDSLKFTMSYIFKEKKEVDIKGKITFLEGEELKILSLHAFSEKGLIDFYEKHGFKFIEKSICGLRGQFLFEKE